MKKIYFFFTLALFLNFNINAQVVWTGTSDGTTWTDAANWDTGAVPTANDLVEINSDATITSATAVAAAQVKIAGESTVTLDLDLTAGDGTTVEHAVTVSLNSSLTFGSAGANRTITFNPEATRQGIAVFGSSENATITVTESTTLNFVVANNAVNLVGTGSTLTNDGSMNFAGGVKNAFKVLANVINNGSITIENVTGDAVGVGLDGIFINNGTITVNKPNNDAVEVEGGTFNNNGTITATIKDDAGSGNNVIAVGTAEVIGTFFNGADGVINGDAGMAENARAISVNELGTFSNAGTMTLTGGNDGSRFYTRGTSNNDFNGVIDLTDGRINVNMGIFANGGLIKTTRDGAGVTAGEMGTAINNAFIDYASTNNFAIGMGAVTDNGLSLNANAVNYSGQCFDTIALQTYEYFYEGNSIGSTNADGELDVTGSDFMNPDSVQITTSIPGVEFFIKNYCAEAIFDDMTDAVNNLEVAALKVYPTLAAAGTTLTVDLTGLNTTEAEMTLTDFTGKTIQIQTLRGGEMNRVESANVNAGIYFMHVYTEGKVLTAKLILQ